MKLSSGCPDAAGFASFTFVLAPYAATALPRVPCYLAESVGQARECEVSFSAYRLARAITTVKIGKRQKVWTNRSHLRGFAWRFLVLTRFRDASRCGNLPLVRIDLMPRNVTLGYNARISRMAWLTAIALSADKHATRSPTLPTSGGIHPEVWKKYPFPPIFSLRDRSQRLYHPGGKTPLGETGSSRHLGSKFYFSKTTVEP